MEDTHPPGALGKGDIGDASFVFVERLPIELAEEPELLDRLLEQLAVSSTNSKRRRSSAVLEKAPRALEWRLHEHTLPTHHAPALFAHLLSSFCTLLTDFFSQLTFEVHRPLAAENGKDFAKRLLDEKYGPGNYNTGPGSEYNKIKKWGDRAFE